MVINMGPQHPSTHGVLRLVLQVDGETVLRTIPHIGYLHTGIEKTAENLTWQQAVVVTDRMDYLSPPTNNLAYALAVEKLMGIEVPERAQDIRVLIAELTRLASHLIALGTHAMELGAMSVFFYCWRDRELILDIMDFLSGVRMMTSFINIGGVRADLPDGFHKKVQDFLDVFPARVDEYDGLLTNNRIWEKRTLGICVITPEDALDYGLSGPNIRGSGIKWDLRKDRPYLTYPKYSFDVPVGKTGDVYDRYLVRLEEMRQSREICVQALKNISPRGEFRTADRKISPPPKEELERNMEALIHHFLLYTRGFEPPEGEVYSTIESARGELGIYLVSDGSNKPYRMHVRAPSFVSLQILPAICEGGLVADVIAAIGSLDPVMGEVDR
ncbi:MAG: NADH dehydrogenase (quinone) subunit D [Nitrospirota bacterium]